MPDHPEPDDSLPSIDLTRPADLPSVRANAQFRVELGSRIKAEETWASKARKSLASTTSIGIAAAIASLVNILINYHLPSWLVSLFIAILTGAIGLSLGTFLNIRRHDEVKESFKALQQELPEQLTDKESGQ